MRLKPRRTLLVDPEIQGALLLRIFVYWCFSVLTVCLITLALRALRNPPAHLVDYFAFGELFKVHGTILVVSALLVPLIMCDLLVITNRFAGPMTRLRRSIRAFSKGERVEPIHFREKDYWREFADEFNAMIAYVEDLKRQLAEAEHPSEEPRDFQAVGHH